MLEYITETKMLSFFSQSLPSSQPCDTETQQGFRDTCRNPGVPQGPPAPPSEGRGRRTRQLSFTRRRGARSSSSSPPLLFFYSQQSWLVVV